MAGSRSARHAIYRACDGSKLRRSVVRASYLVESLIVSIIGYVSNVENMANSKSHLILPRDRRRTMETGGGAQSDGGLARPSEVPVTACTAGGPGLIATARTD